MNSKALPMFSLTKDKDTVVRVSKVQPRTSARKYSKNLRHQRSKGEVMGRGRGKGKRGGRGGGGRQQFVSSLEELESRNIRDEAFAARRKAEREGDESEEDGEGKKEGSGEDGSEGESEEEERGEGVPQGGAAAAAAASAGRAEPGGAEAAMKKPKAKGVGSLIEVANPNAKVNPGRMMKAKVSRIGVGQYFICVQSGAIAPTPNSSMSSCVLVTCSCCPCLRREESVL